MWRGLGLGWEVMLDRSWDIVGEWNGRYGWDEDVWETYCYMDCVVGGVSFGCWTTDGQGVG